MSSSTGQPAPSPDVQHGVMGSILGACSKRLAVSVSYKSNLIKLLILFNFNLFILSTSPSLFAVSVTADTQEIAFIATRHTRHCIQQLDFVDQEKDVGLYSASISAVFPLCHGVTAPLLCVTSMDFEWRSGTILLQCM